MLWLRNLEKDSMTGHGKVSGELLKVGARSDRILCMLLVFS